MARILIVDDESFFRRMLSHLLACAGYEIESAENAEQAWVRICDSGPYDLMISDLVMPGMSGIDLVRKLRDERPERVPVLILTARGQQITEDEARASGADAFMTKPFGSHELLKTVSSLVDSGRAVGAEDEAGEATGTDG